MKHQLSIGLLGLLLVALLVYSCRPDYLQEQEAEYEAQIPQLTSKIMALSQSQHKEQLFSTIKASKQKLRSQSTNLFGKTVSFGDSMSINTDHVIYIENGPNYHTYTFNIQRTNPQSGDPVENLLLTPLPDGTYKEFLVTYHLTSQEKENINNGLFLYNNDNTTVVELTSGTFNGNHQLARYECTWGTETIWVPCSGSQQHDGSNFHDCPIYNNLLAGTPPTAYTVTTLDCGEVPIDQSFAPSPSPSNPVGGGAGTGTDSGNDNTRECIEVPTDPTDPSTGIGDDGGCELGLPTLPNLGEETKTPCEKIKAQREEDAFKKRVDTLQANVGLEKETGYIQKWGGDYEYKDNAGATPDANTLQLPPTATNTYIRGYIHTHVDSYSYGNPNGSGVFYHDGIKIFSPADVNYFMKLIKNAQDKGKPLDDVYAVMVSGSGNKKCNYQLRFTGNQYQIKTFTKEQITNHDDLYKDFMKDFIDKQDKLEVAFLWYISEKMNLKGVSLYRMNDDGTTTEIKLNDTKTDTVETNCPN